MTYNMYIFLNSDYESYIIYYINIYFERDGTWTKVIQEDEPYNPVSKKTGYTNKTLQIIHNYTGFFENGNRYVDVSLNLSTIGFPNRYYIDYTTTANKNGISLEDYLKTHLS